MIPNRIVASTLVAALTVAGCGSGDEADGAGSEDGPSIVATTSIWSDITSAVACGTSVSTLIPAGADPHTYEASLRDRELLTGADVVIANGAGLEATNEAIIAAAIDEGVNVVEIATHVDLLVDAEGHDDHDDEAHDSDHDDEAHDDEDHEIEVGDDPHGHGRSGDPHIWQDPTRIVGAIGVIESALDAADVTTCADDFRDELVALDADITEILSDIPADERLLVTNHDSLAYFADRYEFEIIGTVIPSTSTLADTSAGLLADLADVIETHHVRVIFTDALETSTDASALADRLGIAVVPLATGSLTTESPTYLEMMHNNATLIAEALRP